VQRNPHPLYSMLRHQGEPTLCSLTEICTRRAEELEREGGHRARARPPIPRRGRRTGRGEARRSRSPGVAVLLIPAGLDGAPVLPKGHPLAFDPVGTPRPLRWACLPAAWLHPALPARQNSRPMLRSTEQRPPPRMKKKMARLSHNTASSFDSNQPRLMVTGITKSI
jgi:hypothetical protein